MVKQYLVEDDLVLNQQQLQDLIAMTPYAYKAKVEKRTALEAQAELNVQASFMLYLFCKK